MCVVYLYTLAILNIDTSIHCASPVAIILWNDTGVHWTKPFILPKFHLTELWLLSPQIRSIREMDFVTPGYGNLLCDEFHVAIRFSN